VKAVLDDYLAAEVESDTAAALPPSETDDDPLRTVTWVSWLLRFRTLTLHKKYQQD
jgi:hypothetical protein